MAEVEAPLVGAEVDTEDPSGSAVSIVMAILGVGLASVIVAYGREVGNVISDTVASKTGMDASGDNSGLEL